MFIDDWEKLRPLDFAGYRVSDFISSGSDRALFRARKVNGQSGSTEEASDETFTIGFREYATESEAEEAANRLREAEFLSHPNLIKVFAEGVTQHDLSVLLFYVTESFSHTMSEANFAGSDEIAILLEIAPPILKGLRHLHQENFVYCALGLRTVWRAGNEWKLADFSEIRVVDTRDRVATRRMLTRADISSPPEAYQGVVVPSWDAWSFGSLLREALARAATTPGEEVRTGHLPLLSRQSNGLIAPLLDPDPSTRLTLDEFEVRLESGELPAEELEPESVSARNVALSGSYSTSSAASGRPEGFRKWQHVSPVPADPAGFVSPSERPLEQIPAGLFEPDEEPRASRRYLVAALAGMVALGVMGFALSNGGTKSAASSAATDAVAKTSSSSSLSGRKPPPFQPLGATPEPKDKTEEAVLAVLKQWVESMRARDVDLQMACYAPVVDRYFGRKSVTRYQLREEKRKLFSQIGNVQDFSLSQVRFSNVGPKSVVVIANKTWDFPERHFSGTAREELILRPYGGAWKISSERDSKVDTDENGMPVVPRPKSATTTTRLPAPVTSDPAPIIAGARP